MDVLVRADSRWLANLASANVSRSLLSHSPRAGRETSYCTQLHKNLMFFFMYGGFIFVLYLVWSFPFEYVNLSFAVGVGKLCVRFHLKVADLRPNFFFNF